MKNYLKSTTCIGIVLLLFSCNIDFKEGRGVSESINESKERNAFIKEYQIKNIQSFNDSLNFPISKAWLEKCWRRKLNESGKEISVIDTSGCCYKVIFELKEVNKQDFFQKDTYIREWCIKDDYHNPTGIINRSTIFNTLKESKDVIYYTIYKKISPYSTSETNILPLFKFDLETRVINTNQ